MKFKLVDRSKFTPIGGSKWADAPSQDGNNFPGRIYNSVGNVSKMTMFERLWLTPELYHQFGKYRKANVFWFLLTFFFPFLDDLWHIVKKENILELTIVEFFAVILCIPVMLCGLGWIWSVLRARHAIKQAKWEMERYYKDGMLQ